MLLSLLRPFGYLTIHHKSRMPQLVNWLLPVFLAGILTFCVFVAGAKFDVFSSNGVVSRLLSFIQNLPGFYIAALAAIATFDSPNMLTLMPGTPPTVSVHHQGKVAVVQLTRRRFLSLMFAFLTASSVIATLLSIAALSCVDYVKSVIPAVHYVEFKLIFVFLYFTFVAQLLCVTMWGLFYLGERIHTPD